LTLFAGASREELRALYVESWRKFTARLPASPLETMIAQVVAMHPEYHALLENPHRAEEFEPPPTDAAGNPFLHMGLHLAVRDQISVDRPVGIRALAHALEASYGAHEWEHALMQALGEVLWDAQRAGVAPDEALYLARARALLKG